MEASTLPLGKGRTGGAALEDVGSASKPASPCASPQQ